jgi:hypothetical protein
VARSLITASRDPNDSVLSASFRIVASMLDKFSLPSIAIAPVFPAISFTATMVCVSSFPVTLISSTAGDRLRRRIAKSFDNVLLIRSGFLKRRRRVCQRIA